MNQPGILLAAGAPWPLIVAIAIGGLIHLINQVVGGQKPRVPPNRAPRPPGPQAGRAEPRDEVSEFLRQAAQRRSGPAARPDPPKSERPRPKPPLRNQTTNKSQEPVQAEAVDSGPSGSSVAAHVRQHLDNREFSERASHLSDVDQQGQQMQSHLHQVFDHQVGHLKEQSATSSQDVNAAPTMAISADVRSNSANSLVAMLSNPEGIRDAIVLNEILRRPDERW